MGNSCCFTYNVWLVNGGINMDRIEEELIRRKIRSNKWKIITNVFLIIVLLGIAFYVIKEIETFKMLNQDICAYCMERTGAICYPPIK